VRLTPSTIQDAVRHEDWQRFRKSLKGKATPRKLGLLLVWIHDFSQESRYEQRLIQVQNYLNALARGRQIAVTDKNRGVWQQVSNAKVLK